MTTLETALATVLLPFGAADPVPDESAITPGWWGALVILGLIVVTILLWLSMRRQMGRIHFDDGSEPQDEATEDRPDERP